MLYKKFRYSLLGVVAILVMLAAFLLPVQGAQASASSHVSAATAKQQSQVKYLMNWTVVAKTGKVPTYAQALAVAKQYSNLVPTEAQAKKEGLEHKFALPTKSQTPAVPQNFPSTAPPSGSDSTVMTATPKLSNLVPPSASGNSNSLVSVTMQPQTVQSYSSPTAGTAQPQTSCTSKKVSMGWQEDMATWPHWKQATWTENVSWCYLATPLPGTTSQVKLAGYPWVAQWASPVYHWAYEYKANGFPYWTWWNDGGTCKCIHGGTYSFIEMFETGYGPLASYDQWNMDLWIASNGWNGHGWF